LRVRWPVENPVIRWLWEKFRLPGILKKLEADILFCPGGLINTVPPDKCETITMFRNMVPFDLEQRRRYPIGYMRMRNWILEKSMLRSMLHANLVIFVSEFAKGVIDRRANGKLSKSVVIPHGIGADFRMRPDGAEPERPEWLPEEEYFLYVSSFDFYKAQIEVVQGYALLRELGHTRQKLVLVGAENTAYGRLLRKEIGRLGLKGSVVLVGYVPRSELPGAYQHALVNIFASECENCPNILLEAMAAGKPVVVSDRQPMPEFGGDAVVYFNPSSPRDFAESVAQLIDDPVARAQLSYRARERARLYQWGPSVRETWRSLENLASSSSLRVAG
jgi:glycosyltransferase involved in cell wall biosynthesis